MWIWVKCLWKEQIYREGEREKNQQNMQTHTHIYTHRMLNVSTQNINIYALAELGMAVIAAEINVSLLTVYFIFLWRSHFVFTDLKETHSHIHTNTHKVYTPTYSYIAESGRHYTTEILCMKMLLGLSFICICTSMYCTSDKNCLKIATFITLKFIVNEFLDWYI